MRALAVAAALLLTGGVGWYLVARDSPDEDEASAKSGDEPRSRRDRAARSGPDRGGSPSDEPRRDGTLEQRVARLEDEVAMLRRQLALRGRVPMSGGADARELAEDPVLGEQVREIFEEERQREREHEDEVRRERFEEMRTAALDELVSVAGLTEQQRETIDGLWNGEADRVMPLIQSARSGDRSFGEIREELEAIRKETDDAAKAAMSEDQYEHYDELRPRGPGRRGGRGDRGGRGERGGRGDRGDRGGPPGPG
ncbi:hypothetical protein [Paraliomyxa miuraensis]|uniref:hypothetical protein n=1 Tax=Paraliomyxa miuraensis TaxID=376150 RepID=UPI00224E8A01|nr:hypothetical protein [Paraliomyxa miuraensis]MCX4240684.1 hypothetical protein [Paraliomyxa miuraensis]